MWIPSQIQICTHCTKWLNHTGWKTEPGTGSSDCRCPLSSVTQPRASNWNHILCWNIILLWRYRGHLLTHGIFPLSDPSLPVHTHTHTPEWSHLHLQPGFISLAGRMIFNSGSLNAHLLGLIFCVTAGHISRDNSRLNGKEIFASVGFLIRSYPNTFL